LFATSNFALNILLARWLATPEYGAFGVAFAISIFIGTMYQAALLEPMLVFGSGKYKDSLSKYLGTLFYGHLGLASLGSLALALLGLGLALWSSRELSTVILALALTQPFILLLWLMRRACYVRLKPHLAAYGGGWYMVLMLAGAFVIYRSDRLSAPAALGVMAISSLVVSLWLAVRLGFRIPSFRKNQTFLHECLNDHWRYGRWSMANQALHWIPTNSFYLLVPIWGGLAAGASFKALMNLIMPVLQGVWALSILLLPALVRALNEGYANLNARMRLALVPFVLGTLLYWVLLGLFHYQLVSWLYNGRYTEYSYLLWIVGAAPIFIAVKLVVGHTLRALERPNWLFIAYLVSAVVALALGFGLIPLYGIAGAATALLVSQVVTAVLVIMLARRLRYSFEAGHERQAPVEEEHTVSPD
jgi:O-antigen/teichoic acid export membrane protein